MTKKDLRKLLDSRPSFERDRKIKEWQNKFILKTGISRRLFDQLFQRCSKKKHTVTERRTDLMDKKQ